MSDQRKPTLWIALLVLGVLNLIAVPVGVALMIAEGRVATGLIVAAFGSLVGGVACTSFAWSMLRRSCESIGGTDGR